MDDRSSELRNRVACSYCGTSEHRRHGVLPLGWQELRDASRGIVALCPQCVRRNLWLIEARLEIDPGLET